MTQHSSIIPTVHPIYFRYQHHHHYHYPHSGDFLGVELSTPTGKNNSSPEGIVHFSCKPQHGLFLKPASIQRINSHPIPPPQGPLAPDLNRQAVDQQDWYLEYIGSLLVASRTGVKLSSYRCDHSYQVRLIAISSIGS